MCYTSGTTGSPKGVVYSHRSTWLHTMAEQAASSVGMTETDRILIIVPMFHANAWGTPYGAWMAGTDMIMPQMFLMGEQLAAVINEFHPTLACGVPTIWNGLLALDTPIDFSSVRAITAGGAAVPQSLIEAFEKRFGVTIIQGWGMTETSPLAAFGLPPARRLNGHDDMYYKIKAGRVVGGVEVRVVAEDGTVLPNDGTSVGEFEIRGPWITGSYYKDEDPAKFHDGWLRTGDVGTLDGQGYMTISDRTKDVIKSGGEWISSVELENAVMAHPDVFEAAVIAVPDPKWSERPLVAVVPKPGPLARPGRPGGLPGRPRAPLVAARPVGLHRPGAQDERREVRQEGHAGRLRRRCLQGAEHAAAQVSGANEAVADLAERLEGVLEELTDMALDALRLASAGDPDSAETGEALALERRILKARRALERCVAALREGSGSGARSARRRRGLTGRPAATVRTFVAAWPDEPTRQRLAALELGREKNLRLVGPGPLARHAALPGRAARGPARARGRRASGPAWPRCPGPVECRLGPATAWFSGVRVLQLPAHGLDELARRCAGPPRPSSPNRPGDGPPFNGHLTLARVKGRLGARGAGRAGRHPLRRHLSPWRTSTWWPRSPRRGATSTRRWCGRPSGLRPDSGRAAGEEGRDGLGHGGGGRLLERRGDEQRGVGGVAHVAALDEHLGHRGEVQPGQVAAGLQAVDAVVGADRHGGAGGEGVAQRGGEGGRGRDDAVVRPVGRRFEHREAPPVDRPPVGVDVDGDVGVGVVDDGGPRRDAGPDAGVVRAGQHDGGALRLQVGLQVRWRR